MNVEHGREPTWPLLAPDPSYSESAGATSQPIEPEVHRVYIKTNKHLIVEGFSPGQLTVGRVNYDGRQKTTEDFLTGKGVC